MLEDLLTKQTKEKEKEMKTFLPNLLDWDVYSAVVMKVMMIRVCTELEKRMKGELKEIDSPARIAFKDGGDVFGRSHPARSILGASCWTPPIDRIVGDMVVNGRTYCLPSRYYLGGKLLRPGGARYMRGMCVWFDLVEQEKIFAEMGYRCEPRYSASAKKKIYDYFATKE